MRLNGLGPSPSLYNQRQIHSNGQVKTEQTNAEVEPKKVQDESVEKDPLNNPDVQRQVAELKVIEDKVIAHEQAHKSVGGEFTGAVNYGYTVGPDGKRYITSGEVSISVPGSGEPESLLRAMQRVKNAALAPASPSSQDQSVAASAAAKILSLQSEIAKKNGLDVYSEGGDPQKVFPEGPPEDVGEDKKHLDIVI